MDACESGELYDDEYEKSTEIANGSGIASRGFKFVNSNITTNITSPIKKFNEQKDRYIYNDLHRRSGAIVFSSSRGGESSYERSDISNGLFTEFIINALTRSVADKDWNGIVTIKELRDYVSEQVSISSGGLQNPTIDRDNIYQDFNFKIGKVTDWFNDKGININNVYREQCLSKEKIYYTGFSEQSNDWPINSDESKSSVINPEGYYEIKSLKKGNQPIFVTNVVDIDLDRDFEIEASMKYCSGEDNNINGIVYGYDSNTAGQYRFAFTGNGLFGVLKWHKEWTYLRDYTQSSLVSNNSFNKLTIRKIGTTCYFFINEKPVCLIPFMGFFGQEIGFCVNQNTTIQVDYFSVSYITPKNNY
jgi:hypothetical protein